MVLEKKKKNLTSYLIGGLETSQKRKEGGKIGGKGKALCPRQGGLGHEQKPSDSHKNRSLTDPNYRPRHSGPANLSSCGALALRRSQGKGFKQANGDLQTAVLEKPFWREDVAYPHPHSNSLLPAAKGSQRKANY